MAQQAASEPPRQLFPIDMTTTTVAPWRAGTNPADTEKNIGWARQFWKAMQPYCERSAYVNDLGDEGDQRIREAYGPNYDRLLALKQKYDPTNFFHLNQNISPAQASSATLAGR